MIVILYPSKAHITGSQSLIHQVSVSDYDSTYPFYNRRKTSQSLIHQVSVSDLNFTSATNNRLDAGSQSLIHQVSVSDMQARHWMMTQKIVSIPYSSGLSFRCCEGYIWKNHNKSLNPLFIRSQFQIISKEILCQISQLVSIPYSSGLSFRFDNPRIEADKHYYSLNPLFIRSQFQILCLVWRLRWQTCSLNPLFIRSQFQMAAFFQPINTDT